MKEVMQFLRDYLRPIGMIFTVSNLATMGLRVKMPN